MSQHYCRSTYQGKPVEVEAGWDPPRQHFFLRVVTVPKGRGRPKTIFDSLELPETGLANAIDVEATMEELHITVPNEMLTEMSVDAVFNRGNVTKRHGLAP